MRLERGREGGRAGGTEGGRKGRREGGREGGRERERERERCASPSNSLRAQFGETSLRNGLHGSSSTTDARAVIHEVFGDVSFNPDGTAIGMQYNMHVHDMCALSTAGVGGGEEGTPTVDES